MTLEDSTRTADLFGSCASDWTPAQALDVARVVFAPLDSDAEFVRRCASTLSPRELSKAERFLAAEDRARYKQQRAFRRYCGKRALGSSRPLSQIDFEEDEKGRPFLRQAPEVCFSFSSCRFGLLGAWSATHFVGVDIEDLSRPPDIAEMAQGYFSRSEALAVERAGSTNAFFALWTLKEAALKAIGEGLPFGLEAFEFELRPRLRVVCAPQDRGGAEAFRPHLIDRADLCAALVTAERNEASG